MSDLDTLKSLYKPISTAQTQSVISSVSDQERQLKKDKVAFGQIAKNISGLASKLGKDVREFKLAKEGGFGEGKPVADFFKFQQTPDYERKSYYDKGLASRLTQDTSLDSPNISPVEGGIRNELGVSFDPDYKQKFKLSLNQDGTPRTFKDLVSEDSVKAETSQEEPEKIMTPEGFEFPKYSQEQINTAKRIAEERGGDTSMAYDAERDINIPDPSVYNEGEVVEKDYKNVMDVRKGLESGELSPKEAQSIINSITNPDQKPEKGLKGTLTEKEPIQEPTYQGVIGSMSLPPEELKKEESFKPKMTKSVAMGITSTEEPVEKLKAYRNVGDVQKGLASGELSPDEAKNIMEYISLGGEKPEKPSTLIPDEDTEYSEEKIDSPDYYSEFDTFKDIEAPPKKGLRDKLTDFGSKIKGGIEKWSDERDAKEVASYEKREEKEKRKFYKKNPDRNRDWDQEIEMWESDAEIHGMARPSMYVKIANDSDYRSYLKENKPDLYENFKSSVKNTYIDRHNDSRGEYTIEDIDNKIKEWEELGETPKFKNAGPGSKDTINREIRRYQNQKKALEMRETLKAEDEASPKEVPETGLRGKIKGFAKTITSSIKELKDKKNEKQLSKFYKENPDRNRKFDDRIRKAEKLRDKQLTREMIIKDMYIDKEYHDYIKETYPNLYRHYRITEQNRPAPSWAKKSENLKTEK